MIEIIKKPIIKEFLLYDKKFKEMFSVPDDLLGKVLSYVSTKRGKEVRPVFTLLSSALCGNINSDSINNAVAIEMLHLSSLLHDDVVDYTQERRYKPSANALWNNKISVLVGDYIFSRSVLLSRNYASLFADLCRLLSEGEIMELSLEKKIDVTEKEYMEVIRKKTAVTFSFAGKIGALCSKADANIIEDLAKFGFYLGMIFQIKDDVLDYSVKSDIGKPVFNDIREGKITLPLIYSLKKAAESSDKDSYNGIKNIIDKDDFTDENIEKIYSFVVENGGIKYSDSVMKNYALKASAVLDNFDNSVYKDSMKTLLDFFLNRKA